MKIDQTRRQKVSPAINTPVDSRNANLITRWIKGLNHPILHEQSPRKDSLTWRKNQTGISEKNPHDSELSVTQAMNLEKSFCIGKQREVRLSERIVTYLPAVRASFFPKIAAPRQIGHRPNS
jgi:hypothetical protein